MGIVSYFIEELPPPSREELALMRAIGQKPDEEIDLSDIPELTEEELAQMRPARLKIGFYRETAEVQ